MAEDIYDLLVQAKSGNDPYFIANVQRRLAANPHDVTYGCVAAVCHWEGWGVEPNKKEAMTLFEGLKNKFEANCNDATYAVIQYYWGLAFKYGLGGFNKDNSSALAAFYQAMKLNQPDRYYDKAARDEVRPILEMYFANEADIDTHSATLLNNLGCFLYCDYVFAKDHARALRYYRASAEKGSSYGLRNLAMYYETGVTVDGKVVLEKNLKQAIHYYCQALEPKVLSTFTATSDVTTLEKLITADNIALDNNDACSLEVFTVLGICYLEGYGCKQDPVIGLKYLMHNANQNYEKAKIYLDKAYQSGKYDELVMFYLQDGPMQDFDKAAALACQALQNARTTSNFKQKLFNKLQQIAKLDNVKNYPILLTLGNCYSEGIYTAKNPTQAMDYFLRAAQQDEAGFQKIAALAEENPDNSVYNSALGICYVESWGVNDRQLDGMAIFKRLVDEDDIDKPIQDIAHFYSGLAFENGQHGYEACLTEAVHHYNHATYVTLGSAYGKNKACERLKALLPDLKKLAAEEHANGQLLNHIGFLYGLGVVTPRDEKTALYYYERSAEKGDSTGCYNSGLYYFFGRHGNLNCDYKKAVEYYCQVLEQKKIRGNIATYAFTNIQKAMHSSPAVDKLAVQAIQGICYLDGHGTVVNKAKGIELLTAAAAGGCEKAQYYLGQAFEQGNGVEADLVQASALYLAAAAHNTHNNNGTVNAVQRLLALANIENPGQENISALRNYGLCLQHGYGAEENVQQAITYYTAAAKLGDSLSLHYLILLYLQNEQVKDFEKALGYILQAVEDHRLDAELQRNLLANPKKNEQAEVEQNKGASILLEEIAKAGESNVNILIALGKVYLQACQQNKELYKITCDYYLKLWNNPHISDEQLQDILRDLQADDTDNSFSLLSLFGTYVSQGERPHNLDLVYYALAQAYENSNESNKEKAAYYYFQSARLNTDNPNRSQQATIRLLAIASASEQPSAAISYYVGQCHEFGYGIELNLPAARLHYQQTIELSQNQPTQLELATRGQFEDMVGITFFDLIKNNQFNQADNLLEINAGFNFVAPETNDNCVHVLVNKAEAELTASELRESIIQQARKERKVVNIDEVTLPANSTLKKLLNTQKVRHLIQQQNINNKTPIELARHFSIITSFTDVYRVEEGDAAHYGKALYAALVAQDFVAAEGLRTAGAPYELIDDHNNNIFHRLAAIHEVSNKSYIKLINRYTKFYTTLLLDKNLGMTSATFIAKLVLEKNADKKSPLDIAMEQKNSHAIEAFCNLLKWNKLYLAIYRNDVAAVRQAILTGEDPKARDNLGITPIRLASMLNHWDLVKHILPAKIDRSERRPFGEVLHLAVTHRQIGLAQHLIKLGASTTWQPNSKRPTKDPLVHVALRNGDLALLDLLLSYVPSGKIDGNVLNLRGQTLLEAAASTQKVGLLKYLLKYVPHSINVRAINADGKTALEVVETMRRLTPPQLILPQSLQDNPEAWTPEQTTEYQQLCIKWDDAMQEFQEENEIIDEMITMLIEAEKIHDNSFINKVKNKITLLSIQWNQPSASSANLPEAFDSSDDDDVGAGYYL